jgi:3-methyladenine DNA glycosylase AlkC
MPDWSKPQKPENHEIRVGSPFCSDPNCPYCQELRQLHEELRRKKAKDGAA